MKNVVNLIKVYVVVVVSLLPIFCYAQSPGFGDGVDDVPIDGGLSLLVAAGVGYGVKKLKRKDEKKG